MNRQKPIPSSVSQWMGRNSARVSLLNRQRSRSPGRLDTSSPARQRSRSPARQRSSNPLLRKNATYRSPGSPRSPPTNRALINAFKTLKPEEYRYLVPVCSLFKDMLSSNSAATKELCRNRIIDQVNSALGEGGPNKHILIMNNNKGITISRKHRGDFVVHTAKLIENNNNNIDSDLGPTLIKGDKPIYTGENLDMSVFSRVPGVNTPTTELHNYHRTGSLPGLSRVLAKQRKTLHAQQAGKGHNCRK